MFCPSCGARNPDGAKFCSSCGAGLPNMTPLDPVAPNPKGGKLSASVVAVIIAAAVLLIVLAVVLILKPWDSGSSGGRDRDGKKTSSSDKVNKDDEDDRVNEDKTSSGAEDVAEDFLVAWFTGDADTMAGLFSEDVLRIFAEGEGQSLKVAKKELVEECQGVVDQLCHDQLDNADFSDVKVRVSGLKDSKVLSSSDVRRFRSDYVDRFDIEIEDAVWITCTLTVTVKGEKRVIDLDEYKSYVPVVKIGGEWYIDSINVNDALFESFI